MKIAAILAGLALAASSLAANAVGRLADLSVLDRSTGRVLPVYWHEGRAYVVGRPGNEYKVVLRNRSGEDLLAVVSVDGVNVLSGQTANADQGGYVLSPRERLDIAGWRKNLGETASFYFTSLGDSYAGRTGRPTDVGVIGVALFNRAPHYRYEAPAEIAPEPWQSKRDSGSAGALSESRPKSMAPGAPIGTGHGRRESSPAQYTEFERATRDPIEVVAIYYDSYRNLVAQGVLPTYGARRDPNPFPSGFVADPPRW
jgi:hypothetical protein